MDWYADGNGPPGGATVTVETQSNGTITTVTATASGMTERFFLRAGVIRN